MSEKIETLKEKTVLIPMRFSHVKTPSWLKEMCCQKCNEKTGGTLWMVHSTPYTQWETDYAFGEFVLCDECGFKEKAILETDLNAVQPRVNG